MSGEAEPPPGRRVDREVTDEREHFVPCTICGQMVDLRDAQALLRHQLPGHEPDPVN